MIFLYYNHTELGTGCGQYTNEELLDKPKITDYCYHLINN